MVQRPTVKRLCVNGKVSEDREEWMGEVGAHCQRCFDVSHWFSPSSMEDSTFGFLEKIDAKLER